MQDHDQSHSNVNPDARRDASNDVRRATRRNRFRLFFIIAALAAVVWSAVWIARGRYVEETDDAYVAGDIVQIAAQTSGAVTDVLVNDAQPVRAGDTLVRLDDTEAAVAFAQAKAQLVQAVRQARSGKLSDAMYAEAVKARQADLVLARRALAARDHASIEIVAPEELARTRAALADAQANLAAALARRDAARAGESALPVDENPAVVQATAQFRLAYRNLARAAVIAPVGGVIAQRTVQVGQHVRPGVLLMSIVQLNRLWVEANFKEGQIRHMRVGQPVSIVSDIYGSRVVYRGHVRGFSAGTGSAFSMLPPQNAAGNWIKVVQRVPVVIAIEPADLAAHPLKIGLSMQVTIDTRDRAGRTVGNAPPVSASGAHGDDRVAREADAAAAAVIRAGAGD